MFYDKREAPDPFFVLLNKIGFVARKVETAVFVAALVVALWFLSNGFFGIIAHVGRHFH